MSNRLLYALLRSPSGKHLEDFLPEVPDVWLFPNINILRTKLPYAMTVHDVSFLLYPEFFTRKDRAWYRVAGAEKLIKRAASIFAVSDRTKNDLIEYVGVNKDRVHVTPLGVGDVYHEKELPSDRSYLTSHKIRFPYFLTLSTLEPRKNLESVVEAYSTWRARDLLGVKPHLVIAGGRGWKTSGLDQIIERSAFKNDIHLIGYVPEAHKPALYRHAEALIFPSFYEGFGLPPLEASRCGTPIIASFSASLPEVLGDGAIYVDPYNVTDLVQAIEVVMNTKLNKKVHLCPDRDISEPHHMTDKRFSWLQTAKKTLNALHQIRG
jgi:glycosyltransferase involved in cell wall biosynthesis